MTLDIDAIRERMENIEGHPLIEGIGQFEYHARDDVRALLTEVERVWDELDNTMPDLYEIGQWYLGGMQDEDLPKNERDQMVAYWLKQRVTEMLALQFGLSAEITQLRAALADSSGVALAKPEQSGSER